MISCTFCFRILDKARIEGKEVKRKGGRLYIDGAEVAYRTTSRDCACDDHPDMVVQAPPCEKEEV